MKKFIDSIKNIFTSDKAKNQHQVDLIDVKVTRKHALTANVCSLVLSRLDETPLPSSDAGAHIDVYLGNGLTRQYSLCQSPNSDTYEIAVLKESSSRGGSSFIHDNVNEGDILKISPPQNAFCLRDDELPSLLFAAGIGITPILPMAESLAQKSKEFQLIYCARYPDSTPYKDRIDNSNLSAMTTFHYSMAQPNQRLDIAKQLQQYSPTRHIYVCGPNQFIHQVLETAQSFGWQDENLHREFFAAEEVSNAENVPFEVQIKRTEEVFLVPKEQTMLEVLEENNYFVPSSCSEGLCGTCITDLITGQAEHRDLFLSKSEKAKMDKIMPCCSRAKGGRLVIDL